MAQIIVRLKERELKTVPVTCVATRIGRDVSNDVVIDNDGVSRHHATLRYEASVGAFLIYDQSSSNGMFFRGAPSKAARLDDGDEVQIGKFTLVFQEAGGAPIEALTPERILRLKHIVADHAGPCSMELEVVSTRYARQIVFGDKFCVRANDDLFLALERLFGEKVARMV